MDSHMEVSIEQEVNQIQMKRPHIVLLGAGASRATCPNGDQNGKVLPLMNDFVRIIGLESLVVKWGLNPNQNFEEIFSELYEKKEASKVRVIQEVVEQYFGQIILPDKPTVYDHLILSLRRQDVIATFNWDPLLMQAYLRSQKSELSLPRLAFLHGNVMVGYCEKDATAGLVSRKCSKCDKPFAPMPLLYPIKVKDYAQNKFIQNEWRGLKWGLENAFMITIFGYSCPKTDREAIEAMQNAWGDKNQRVMEQTAFITPQSEDEVHSTWNAFMHTHHYEVCNDFYDSWIANHPRRTGEAWINQYLDAKFIDNNPVPRNISHQDLLEWFQKFKGPETNG